MAAKYEAADLSDLHISSYYLGRLLRHLPGLKAQQRIHEQLINKAKEKPFTHLSVSKAGYSLGFEHPQSFSKFLKPKLDSLRWRFGNRLTN